MDSSSFLFGRRQPAPAPSEVESAPTQLGVLATPVQVTPLQLWPSAQRFQINPVLPWLTVPSTLSVKSLFGVASNTLAEGLAAVHAASSSVLCSTPVSSRSVAIWRKIRGLGMVGSVAGFAGFAVMIRFGRLAERRRNRWSIKFGRNAAFTPRFDPLEIAVFAH